MSVESSLQSIDYRWRTERGLQARLVVAFPIIMIGFLFMLLFGCFHPKRSKKHIKKQVHIGAGVTASTATKTKPLIQKSIHFDELGAATNKKLTGAKKEETKKKAAAIRSRQMRVGRAKTLRRDRGRREKVAYIFQDVYLSDNGGVMWT